MQALVVRHHGPIDNLHLEDFEEPSPGPGEVLVDVHAASINFPDLLVIGGTYQRLPATPFVPGKDFAGVVAAVGSGVTNVKPGDRVMAQVEYGAYAARAVARAGNCYRIPERLSFRDAAAMGLVYLTAHLALCERAQLKPGESVLVTGAAGGVGLATVQIAKALGARVIATVSSDEKASLVKQNGADHVVFTNVPNLRDSLREQVFKAVGKGGVDVVIDSVGSDVFDASLRALAWSGRLVIVGFAGGRIPEVKAGYVLVKNISLIGLQAADYRDRAQDKVQAAQAALFDLYEKGRIRPHIMTAYPVAAYREALQTVADRRVLGKVVIEFRN